MASKKAALGRGLDALIADETTAGEKRGDRPRAYDLEDRLRLVGRVADVETDKVQSNPYQPRATFDEAGLEELATSIRQLGIIQPVTVRSVGSGTFELISGERRLRAARMAGLTRIPAYVRQADTEAMLEMAIVENIQREELNPIEVALGYQRLVDEVGLTQEEVADKIGKSRVAVTNTLRLLKLPPFIQALLKTGTLTTGHARALITVEDAGQQQRIVEEIVREGLSVRQVERRVRRLGQPTAKKKRSTRRKTGAGDPNTSAITDKLRTRFGTQVAIRPTAEGNGRIEITYYSEDDLQRILDMLLKGHDD